MKEEIFAIPLWDAFREDKECPLCVIEMDIEKKYIDRLLDGSTVMDVEFNKKLKDYIFVKIISENFLSIRINWDWL